MRTLLLVSFIAWFTAEVVEAKSGLESGYRPCAKINVESPSNAMDMAGLMGSYQIFNVVLLSRYQDESIFSPGEVVVITAENRWPEALQPVAKKGDTHFYQLQRTKEVIALRFKPGKAQTRQLASATMKLFEVDRCAIKKY